MPQGWGGLELEPWIIRNGLPLAQLAEKRLPPAVCDGLVLMILPNFVERS